jgi:tetratricopeptide (TPR) repeat protein
VPKGLLVFTLAIENVGDRDATGVVLHETVPAGARGFTCGQCRSSEGGAMSGSMHANARGQEAQRLLARLMAVPVKEQQARLAEPRFQDPLLFELLVEAGRARLLDDPFGAFRYLTLAVRLAAQLYEGRSLSREIEGEGLSRVVCLAGTACRLLGYYPQAEATFEEAASLAVSASGRGLICRSLGLLRWDQGRSVEAAALLEYAGRRFAEEGDLAEDGVCRALLGLLHVETGDLERATEWLRPACRDVGRCGRPWLVAQSWLGLAFCLAMAGQVEEARAARRAARRYLQGVPEKLRVGLRWLEGRAAVVAGDVEAGAGLLEAARDELVRRRWLPEATLATIDVGRLRGDRQRGDEVAGLVEEMANAFAGRPGIDLAQRMLRRFTEDVVTRQPDRDSWSYVTPRFRLAFSRRGARLRPVPFV